MLFSTIKRLFSDTTGTGVLNLIVTTAIIGTTASFGLANVDDVLAKARDARRQMDMYRTRSAIELYYSDYSQYPVTIQKQPTEAGWQQLQETLTDRSDTGPYISEVTIDPQNEDFYRYRYASDGTTYTIIYVAETTNAPVTLVSL